MRKSRRRQHSNLFIYLSGYFLRGPNLDSRDQRATLLYFNNDKIDFDSNFIENSMSHNLLDNHRMDIEYYFLICNWLFVQRTLVTTRVKLEKKKSNHSVPVTPEIVKVTE